MVPKIQEFQGLVESKNGWDLLVHNKAEEIIMETKTSVRGNLIIRAQGPVDWAPIDIMRCMLYKPLEQQWDLNTASSQVLQRPGVNLLIAHKQTPKRYSEAARDFVTNVISNREADGTVYTIASSTNCAYEVPVGEGVIRADTPVSGKLMRVDPNNPDKTYMTIVNEVDLRGNVPAFALRTAFKDQGFIISRLRKTLPRWKEMFPASKQPPLKSE